MPICVISNSDAARKPPAGYFSAPPAFLPLDAGAGLVFSFLSDPAAGLLPACAEAGAASCFPESPAEEGFA